MKKNSPGCNCCGCGDIYVGSFFFDVTGYWTVFDLDCEYKYKFIEGYAGLLEYAPSISVDDTCRVWLIRRNNTGLIHRFRDTGADGNNFRKPNGKLQMSTPPLVLGYTHSPFAVDAAGNIGAGKYIHRVECTLTVYDKFGDEQWHIDLLELDLMNSISGIDVDRFGNWYVCGSGALLVDSANGERTIGLVKISPTGQLVWATTTDPSPEGEFDAQGILRHCATQPAGDVIWATDGYTIFRFSGDGEQLSRIDYRVPPGETNVLNELQVNDRGYCFTRRHADYGGGSPQRNTRLVVYDAGGVVAELDTAYGYYQGFGVRCNDDEDVVYVSSGDFEREFPRYLRKWNWRTGELLKQSENKAPPPITTGGMLTVPDIAIRPGRAGAFGRLPHEF